MLVWVVVERPSDQTLSQGHLMPQDMGSTSPITNLDAFDVVGVRKDGGLDLVISCAGPLDSSADTAHALRTKIANYLHEVSEARNPTLFERYGLVPGSNVRIILSCAFPVHPEALKVVEDLRLAAHSIDVELLWQRVGTNGSEAVDPTS